MTMTEPIRSSLPAHEPGVPKQRRPRPPKRPKRHAAALSRIAASGIAAATTAALVAVMGAQSRNAGNADGSSQPPTYAGVALPEQAPSTYASPPAPVTATPGATEPVTQSSES